VTKIHSVRTQLDLLSASDQSSRAILENIHIELRHMLVLSANLEDAARVWEPPPVPESIWL